MKKICERYWAIRVGKHFPYLMIRPNGTPELFETKYHAEKTNEGGDPSIYKVVRVKITEIRERKSKGLTQ